MRRTSTTLASKARALVQHGQGLGVEESRMLASARLSALPEQGDGRVASDAVASLWSDLLRWTGDAEVGLRVAESELTSSAYGVVGFRAMTSRTVEEAFGCFTRYARVISDDSVAR